MPQSTIIVTSPRDPAPKWPEGYPEFRGIALSPRDAGHPDDASVSVHSNAVPVMSAPSTRPTSPRRMTLHVSQCIPDRRPMSIGK